MVNFPTTAGQDRRLLQAGTHAPVPIELAQLLEASTLFLKGASSSSVAELEFESRAMRISVAKGRRLSCMRVSDSS